MIRTHVRVLSALAIAVCLAQAGCSSPTQGPATATATESPGSSSTAPRTPTAAASSTSPGAGGAGTRVVRASSDYHGEIARTSRVANRTRDVVADPHPADQKADRWVLEVACSTESSAASTAHAEYTLKTLADGGHKDVSTVTSGILECTSSPEKVTGLHLKGRTVQVTIADGAQPVGSFYGVVYSAA